MREAVGSIPIFSRFFFFAARRSLFIAVFLQLVRLLPQSMRSTLSPQPFALTVNLLRELKVSDPHFAHWTTSQDSY